MMSIAMARLTVRTTLNRMGRFDPEEARNLQQAITLLIEHAIARALEKENIARREDPRTTQRGEHNG